MSNYNNEICTVVLQISAITSTFALLTMWPIFLILPFHLMLGNVNNLAFVNQLNQTPEDISGRADHLLHLVWTSYAKVRRVQVEDTLEERSWTLLLLSRIPDTHCVLEALQHPRALARSGQRVMASLWRTR